jgi:hypothetical protein
MAFVCVVLVSDHDLFPVAGSVAAVQVDVRRTRIGSVVSSAGKDAGDVLIDQPAGPKALKQAKKLKGEVATLILKAASESSDTEGLTGGSSNKKVNWFVVASLDRREVAMGSHMRPVMR